MIKKFAFFIFSYLVMFLPCSSFADEMDFDEFAIVDQEDTTINTEDVSLNSGSGGLDVKHFDIAGVMLGMNYDEIKNLFFDNGGPYAPRKKDSVIYTINKEWKYNLDYECRQNNIFIPEKLEKCIYSLAQNRGLLYIAEIHLERAFTGEMLDIYFTSNATDNLVWKVVYTNDANVLEGVDGNDDRFSNQREKKLLAFWQGVLDKYGQPNSDEDKWISSENAYDPMMQAFYGQLVLSDNGLEASDAATNVQQARKNFQAKPYAF
ncbi:MAG: hypothetical protein IKO56_04675 [Alphaproteobacteria bacterium]|nr:hypothetical protein [Alphaproteobacteria bacterium]